MEEFDKHIKNYRKNLDKSLSISGETSDFFAKYKAEKLYKWFPKFRNKHISILDYGCGDGSMTNHVQNIFPRAMLYGIDTSIQSVLQAKCKFPYINFYTLKNKTINFEKNSFDLIYAAGVFHHISFDQHSHFFDEIMKVLKPGGSFVLFELNPHNPLTRRVFQKCPIDKYATMLKPSYSKKLCKNFKNKIIYYCFFPKFLKMLRCLEPCLSRIPLGALYACIVKK